MKCERLKSEINQEIEGPLLLSPHLFSDERGFFYESWNQITFNSSLQESCQQSVSFVQDNHSRSRRGVLRGLHYQLPPYPQAKLVRCIVGEIYDVAVDLRRGSSTFGQWVGAHLSATNHNQLWIPVGFAHGFLTISEHAEVLYKTTEYWNSDYERSIRWDDPDLSISWPSLPDFGKPFLSEKDKNSPFLKDQQCLF